MGQAGHSIRVDRGQGGEAAERKVWQHVIAVRTAVMVDEGKAGTASFSKYDSAKRLDGL